MKLKLTLKIILLVILTAFSQSLFASSQIVRGINYDPVHSFEFAKAVGLDDKQGMINAINADLDKLIELQNNGFNNIRYLKTFFTTYSSLGNNPAQRVEINIADVVNAWNLQHPQNAIQLALGVYEFRPGMDACVSDIACQEWTQVQVDAAIKSANDYPDLIDRIIVGNENLANDTAGLKLQLRMVEDITKIKTRLNNKSIKVGTAQTSDAVNKIFFNQQFNSIKNVADFIGTNVYPYWGGVAYGNYPYIDSPTKKSFESYWNNINLIRKNNEIIETEEGWPSNGSVVGQAAPSGNYARDYLNYWYNRDAKIAPVSYFFALFDKSPGQGTESHWGIYSADRNASLLGAPNDKNNYNKPLAPGHAIVQFDNVIGTSWGLPKVASIYACTEDWNATTKSQGACYPIDGYARTGDIKEVSKRDFMIDTTGQTYSSLLGPVYNSL